MFWEHLTAPAFRRAVQEVKGVCIVPFGVLESHGPHLPLATDMMLAKSIAAEAAKLERAVIFPDYYIGQLAGVQHIPGNLIIRPELLLAMLDDVCREIGRNGFQKILILNAHGGNPNLIRFFIQNTLQQPRDYIVYSMEAQSMLNHAFKQMAASPFGSDPELTEEDHTLIVDLMESGYGTDHAGFIETSAILAINHELVHMELINDEDFRDQGRVSDLGRAGVFTAMGWYGSYPNNYAGNPEGANERVGQAILRRVAKQTADAIQIIKEDGDALSLQRQFYEQW